MAICQGVSLRISVFDTGLTAYSDTLLSVQSLNVKGFACKSEDMGKEKIA